MHKPIWYLHEKVVRSWKMFQRTIIPGSGYTLAEQKWWFRFYQEMCAQLNEANEALVKENLEAERQAA